MRKTVSIILMTAIIGSTVVSTPVNLYAKEDTKEDKKKTPWEEGKDQGEKQGEDVGGIKGKKDALDSRSFDWEKAFKGLGDIDKLYNIGRVGEYARGFKVGFTMGFEKGYGEGYMEASIEEYEKEVIENIAEEMGIQDASSDYYNKLTLDEYRHRLTDKEIINKFILTGGDIPEYEEIFLVLYRIKYEDTYRKKYRELRMDNFMIDAEGYEQGKKIGEKQGVFSGKIDFVTPNAPNNWEGSLKKFENQKSLIQRYFLDRESEQYRESFITGFREAFRIAYDATYKESNIEIAENNINYIKIAVAGGELEFKPSDGVGSLGGKLKIDNATITQETHIGVSMDRDSFNYKNLKYKPVNHVYNVAVDNLGGVIELEKPMKLQLDHYSTDALSGRAGIYQLVNNEWRYIYTNLKKAEGEDGKITLEAEIPKGIFRGGKYAIFIDEKYKPIEDIKGHWANKELYTFLRRGYIKGFEEKNGTYYHPNTTMKRAHFVELLGNVLGWNYEGMYDNTSKFKDSQYFGEYKKAINYAANMGYISGTPEGNFKPFDTITYQQVEWILRSVLFDNQFKWDGYEEDIKKDRHTNSDSIKGKKQPIKRGEVVYMLHEIQKKNLM